MKKGKLYFLRRHDGLVKIGYSSCLTRRIKALSKSHGTLEVLRIINGDKRREKAIHSKFRHLHEYGEWFRDCDELRRDVAGFPEGDSVEVAQGDVARAWIAGESECVAITKDRVERLLLTRRRRTGGTNRWCFNELYKDYGISPGTIERLLAGKTIVISANTFRRVHEALIAEMTAYRDELLEDVRRMDAGEPFKEHVAPKKWAKKRQA